MKINGPFDKFGKKLPPPTSSVARKQNMRYDILTSADRVKLLAQNYRELKMEEEREKYPLRFLPPMNRNYIHPPSTDSLQDLKRPHVRVTIPEYKNKSLLVSNVIPSWGGSPHSKLNIKLPIDVSLATVLKNIYEHMYQYYFHKQPTKSKSKDAAAARRVIQGLVNKDMRNISNIVRSRKFIPALANLRSVEPFNEIQSSMSSKGDSILPSYLKPNIILSPVPKSMVPIKHTTNLPNTFADIDKANKLAQLTDKVKLTEIYSRLAKLPFHFTHPIGMSPFITPFTTLTPKYKETSRLLAQKLLLPKGGKQIPLQKPLHLKQTQAPLPLSLEPYLRTLSYLKQRDPRVLETEFAKTILKIPLSAIERERKRKEQFSLYHKMKMFVPPQTTKLLKQINPLNVANNKLLTSLQKQKHKFSKKIISKPTSPVSDIVPSNYFLIDTTGVAANKPMVIETVEEFYQKKKANELKRTPPAIYNIVNSGTNDDAAVLRAKGRHGIIPIKSTPTPGAIRNSVKKLPLQIYKDKVWDKRYHVFNPRYYHIVVTKDNIPNPGGKYFNNEEILLQRHHHLHKRLKLMKRFVRDNEGKKTKIKKKRNNPHNNTLQKTINSTRCNFNNKTSDDVPICTTFNMADTNKTSNVQSETLDLYKPNLKNKSTHKRKQKKEYTKRHITKRYANFPSREISRHPFVKISKKTSHNIKKTKSNKKRINKDDLQNDQSNQLKFQSFDLDNYNNGMNASIFNDFDMGTQKGDNIGVVESLTKSLEKNYYNTSLTNDDELMLSS